MKRKSSTLKQIFPLRKQVIFTKHFPLYNLNISENRKSMLGSKYLDEIESGSTKTLLKMQTAIIFNLQYIFVKSDPCTSIV